MAPLLAQVLQRFLAFTDDAAVVLERQPAALADVAQVRGNRRHATAATGDLDHHLRRAPNDSGTDVPVDRRGTLAHASRQAWCRPRPDDAVTRIEESLAPLNEDAVDVRCVAHGPRCQC